MNPDQLPLRDIHLPAPISWWPPAIGWWMLVLVAAVLLVWWLRRRAAMARAPETLAHNELQRLRALWSEHRNTQLLISELSAWLRRVAMSVGSRSTAASLTGESWLGLLDTLAGEPVFDDADRKLLTESPYRGSTSAIDEPHAEHLLTQCERWLSAVKKSKAR
jgi:hypothetical protein